MKACAVLCGSVLEALLIEWLSEIDRKDYINSGIEKSISNMINSLRDKKVLGSREVSWLNSRLSKDGWFRIPNHIFANLEMEGSKLGYTLKTPSNLLVNLADCQVWWSVGEKLRTA